MKNALFFLLICTAGRLSAQTMLAPYITKYAGAWPQVVKIADINGDGRKDVVLATGWYFSPATDATLFAFIQDTTGALGAPVLTQFNNGNGGTAGMGIDAYDFDGDGFSDIVIGFDDTVKVYRSLGNGSFQLQFSINSGYGVDGVSIADLDNDGYMDIAVSHWNSTYLRVMWGTATAFQYTQRTYSTANSGYDQILTRKIGRDTVASLIYMRGQGNAAPLQIFKFGSNRAVVDSISITATGGTSFYPQPHSIAVGDRQNDGYRELGLVWGGNQPDCGISFYDSIVTASPDHVVLTTDIPAAVATGQMNCVPGDEFVIAHSGWNKLSVVSKDTTVVFPVPYASYQPQGVDVGDINGDGYNDVVIADNGHGLVILYNQSNIAAGAADISASQTTICSDSTAQICAPANFATYLWSNGATSQCITTDVPGIYYVTETNASRCSVRSDTVSVTVHQAPQVSTYISQDTIIASGGGDYHWYQNGVLLPGDTAAVYVASGSGLYTVMLTDTNGCSVVSSAVPYIATGISSMADGPVFALYPNPVAQGTVTLSVDGLAAQYPVEIFDAEGESVLCTTIGTGNNTLHIDNMPAGAYLVHCGDKVIKLVKN